MLFFIKQKNKKKGFTLVEMLIAVLIFTVSLSALMSISAKGLKNSRDVQKQITANYLALEAIEIVRNIRDDAFLRSFGGTTWEIVFEGGNIFTDEGCFNDVGKCNFYISSGSQPIIDLCTSCDVYFNEPSFYYYQTQNDSNPGTKSGYTRTIEIDLVSPGQILVKVKVSWDTGDVVYTENLFLWR